MINDQAQTDPKSDVLGFAGFAEHLAKGLTSMMSPEGTVVAIYGRWGAGKTTFLNYVKSYLSECDPRPTVIDDFNPWWFAGHQDLTVSIMDKFQSVFGRTSSKDLKKASEAMKVFGEAIKIVPGFDGVGGLVKGMAGHVGNVDVPSFKKTVGDVLAISDERFIFILDDIDRLPADDIRDLFRVIKSLGDFPNVIYLLAFDREIVANALQKVQEGSGLDYLQKIIQVPFELPAPDETGLSSMFEQSVGQIFRSVKIDQNQLINVYAFGIAKLLKTPRDVVRLANTLSVTFPAVQKELNPVDFIAIETLRLATPAVYELVRQNKSLLVGLLPSYSSTSKIQSDELNTFHDKALGLVPLNEDKNAVSKILQELFPKFASARRNYSNLGDEKSHRNNLRICSDDIFNIYFQFAVPRGQLTETDINSVLSLANDQSSLEQTLISYTNRPGRLGKTLTHSLLFRLVELSDKTIPIQDVASFARVLIKLGTQLCPKSDDSTGPFDYGNLLLINWAILKLLHRIEQDDRIVLLEGATRTASEPSAAVYLLKLLAQEHGRFASSRKSDEPALSESELESFQRLILGLVSETAEKQIISESRFFVDTLEICNEFAPTGYLQKLATRLMESDEGFIAFIRAHIFIIGNESLASSDIESLKWSVKINSFRQHIDLNRAVERVKSIRDGANDYDKKALDTFLAGYSSQLEFNKHW